MPQVVEDTRFQPLPRPETPQGDPRKVGVEIEFGGLTEEVTATLAARHLGGRIVRDGPHCVTVKDTSIGTVKIVLDTALRKHGGNPLVDAGLDAARGLIPIEIVTEPLDHRGLMRLDAFREALRQAHATGTDDGALLGFGVHFNVEVIATDHPYTQNTVLAFALIEDWLRQLMPIDMTRRLMPFVNPWPRAFLQGLVEAGPSPDFETVRTLYATHCNSRNHALDLLPIYKHSDPATFDTLFPKQTNTKGRPAFHYRLPDCRIEDHTWSLAKEWQRWWIVEMLADTPDMLAVLCTAFAKRDPSLLDDRSAWADEVGERLDPTRQWLTL
ncbi:MAG: amidoligase family protein [Pseudomonadota bacterium]